MDINEGLDQVSQMFKGKDWFYEASLGEHGTLVVYAHWISGDILREMPDFIGTHPVLLHYACSKISDKNHYTEKSHTSSVPVLNLVQETIELPSTDLELDLSELRKELFRLEKICGSNILGDIFFESHDKTNAITNLSAKFPEVKRTMDKLYDAYGFDIIYEQLEL